MISRRFTLIVALAFFAASSQAGAMDRIAVSPDGKGFIHASSKKPFTPWGFNYDRDHRSRLIEEYWHDDWDTVAGDFREMKALGANVVRIHLSVAHFLEAPDKPNPRNLDQLAKLLKLCEELDIYLDVTGLGCYRKEDVPAWYVSTTEAERWAIQARFWEAVARTCATSPAVAWYDLMNEPVVPGGKREAGDWLVGHLADFWYVQFISLDQAGRDRPQVARKWIETLAKVIRTHDPQRLVSVGLLPNSLPGDPYESGFQPKVVAEVVDFLCVHMYPGKPPFEADLKTLAGFDVGKPLVIEEIFPMNCTPEELEQFIKLSRKHADGWVGFYWGQTPQELAKSEQIPDVLLRGWLEVFQRNKPAR